MTNGNDSANPQIITEETRAENGYMPDTYSFGGLTKREYFAGLAMQGLLADSDLSTDWDVYANMAINAADALIEALNVEKCRHCSLPNKDGHYDKANDLCSIVEAAK